MTTLAYRVSIEKPTIRANGDSAHFTGYASVYDVWYDVLGGPEAGGWREMVRSGAGRKTLNRKPDVHFLLNHDGASMARTTSGTMMLDEDERGLLVDVPSLDLRSPLVLTVYSAMTRQDMDAMSYAFRVNAQEWNGDYTERTILEYDLAVKGADVSIVTYPANDYTIAQIRSEARVDELRSAVGLGLDVRVARHILDRLRSVAA
jgi:HK97 family phage prohead protease